MLVALCVTVGWIVSVCLHEFAHAAVAYLGGDRSVKDRGYLTLNPFKYTDPALTLVIPTIVLLLGGVALPGAAVLINERRVRSRLWLSAVSAAGPLATGICALLLAYVVSNVGAAHPDEPLWQAVAYLAYIQVVVLFLNLMPVPGLDGYGVISPFLPGRLKKKLVPLERYGFWVLLALLWFVPPANKALWRTALDVVRWLDVPGPMLADGMRSFQSGAAAVGIACVAVAALSSLSRARDWRSRAQKLQSEGRFEECLELLGKELARQPQNTETLKQRGLCCAELALRSDAAARPPADSWKQEAKQAFEKACAMAPDDASLWSARGMSETYLGDFESAVTSLSRAVELAPDESLNWYHRGLAYHSLGNLEQALTNYERAVDLDPMQVEPVSQLAVLLLKLDKYKEALNACERAVGLDSRSSQHWYNRGVALCGLKRWSEARGSFEKALALAPDDVNIWYNLACCCARLADVNAALDGLAKAMELDPEGTAAQAIKEPDFDALASNERFHELIGGKTSAHRGPADGNGSNGKEDE
jgi:tetratricopeptide (TPR) repeat protein